VARYPTRRTWRITTVCAALRQVIERPCCHAARAEYEDRPFRLIYRTLDLKQRARVSLLAGLGLRAREPETAWLVAMFALAQRRLDGFRLILGLAAVAVAAWGFGLVRGFAPPFLFPSVLGVVFVGSAWTNRRAVPVNESIAERPGTR
jgi:hypothetical protein